ncbi:hypothetical protein ACWOFR_06325 [Carnobacterium gallinarum]|uniref:hypothetical protein n=1 Tax=Carnobacterium gallinarum TaxID=2749 RepID=UPI000556C6B0|nr:hypothetical protein [Carnobacterium gallinarum]
MKDKLDSHTISKQLQQVDDEKVELSKKETLWEEYQDHWDYIQQQEQDVLSEIDYLSQQTTSARDASQQLDIFEEERGEHRRFVMEIEDEFDQKKKKLITLEDDLNEDYYEAKKEEAAND